MLKKIVLLLTLVTTFNGWGMTEQECNRIMVAILKDKNILEGGSQGLCVGDLSDLSNVKFALGSSTFALGKADKSSIDTGDMPKKLKELINILETGSGKDSLNTSVIGYADGVHGPSTFSDKFMNEGATFTREDVEQKFSSDPAAKKRLFELIDFDSRKKYKFISEEKDTQGIPESALSIIRNFYLSKTRAETICKSMYDEATANKKCTGENIQNFTSPILESKSAAQRECNGRRTAYIEMDLQNNFTPINPGNDNIFNPQFKSSTGKLQRNIQLASSASFLSDVYAQAEKRATTGTSGSNDPCNPSNPDATAALNNTCRNSNNSTDNAKLLYCHISEQMDKITDENFKKKVTSGDYQYLKKELERLNNSENSDLSVEDRKKQLLLETMTTGSFQYNKNLTVVAKDSSYSLTEYDQPVTIKVNGSTTNTNSYRQNRDGSCSLFSHSMDRKGLLVIREVKIDGSTSCSDIGKKGGDYRGTFKTVQRTKYKVMDKRFPNASHINPTTDIFNCYSPAAALEDGMKDSANGMLVEPSRIMSNHDNAVSSSDKLQINLDPNTIGQVTTSNGEVKKGFVCEMCGRGIEFHQKGATYSTREEEPNDKQQEKVVSSLADKKDLTVGSMKSLKVYNIKRSDLANAKLSCLPENTVCNCLKNIEPGKGQLEKIIASAQSLNIVKSSLEGQSIEQTTFKGKQLSGYNEETMIAADRSDNCLFVPPVIPACKVNPSGLSADHHDSDLQVPSCEFIKRLKEKGYRLKSNEEYLAMPINSVQCEESTFGMSEEACLRKSADKRYTPATTGGSVEEE